MAPIFIQMWTKTVIIRDKIANVSGTHKALSNWKGLLTASDIEIRENIDLDV